VRKAIEPQLSFGSVAIEKIEFDTNCRHEIVPILVSLQHIYSTPPVFNEICELIKNDIVGDKSESKGCLGIGYWEILVLASVRLGCNLDYDALHDLANNHLKLRQIMGLGFLAPKRYPRSTIHSNLSQLSVETLKKISEIIVGEGHKFCPQALERVRGDSVVVEKNIHYPTDTSLIFDGVRKIIDFSVKLSDGTSLEGWRQHAHLLKKFKKLKRKIEKVSKRKGGDKEEKLKELYGQLISEARSLLDRAMNTLTQAQEMKKNLEAGVFFIVEGVMNKLPYYILVTGYMCELAERRVLKGEEIPNYQKLFSIFEPFTELINRGKKPYPIEFGHRVMLVEDNAGFIVDFQVMGKGVTDEKIVVDVMNDLQERYNNKIKAASFDKGFWTPNNLSELSKIVEIACLPKKGKRSKSDAERESNEDFVKMRKWHPGVESAIHALGSGNGLIRCRDKGEEGYDRYVALAVVGRNLHTLGNYIMKKSAKQKKPKMVA